MGDQEAAIEALASQGGRAVEHVTTIYTLWECWWDDDRELLGVFTNKAAAKATMESGLGDHIHEIELRGTPIPTRQCHCNTYLYQIDTGELEAVHDQAWSMTVRADEPRREPTMTHIAHLGYLHIYVPDAPDRDAAREQAEQAVAGWLRAQESKGGES